MRSSARDTPARSCARSVLCWPVFPLVPALRSTDSAAAGAALFAGFSRRMPPAFVRIATISGSDFSCPCIIGYGSSPSRRGPDNPRAARSDMRSPRFRPAPFMRDGVFDHDGVSAPRIAAPLILPSAQGDGLGLRHFQTFAAQYPTPHNCCVRFVAAVAGGPRNTRYRAGASPYPDRTCTGWIRSAYPVAPPRVLDGLFVIRLVDLGTMTPHYNTKTTRENQHGPGTCYCGQSRGLEAPQRDPGRLYTPDDPCDRALGNAGR